jgi:hypothetical protein
MFVKDIPKLESDNALVWRIVQMTARPCLGHDDAILRADELLLLGHRIYIYLSPTWRYITKYVETNIVSFWI